MAPDMMLDRFQSLSVADPVPRAASSMSMHDGPKRHANTLPPDYAMPLSGPSPAFPSGPTLRPAPTHPSAAAQDVSRRFSGPDPVPAAYDDQNADFINSYYADPSQDRSWQPEQQWRPPVYNPLYAAASNVLGGPPPTPVRPPQPAGPPQMSMSRLPGPVPRPPPAQRQQFAPISPSSLPPPAQMSPPIGHPDQMYDAGGPSSFTMSQASLSSGSSVHGSLQSDISSPPGIPPNSSVYQDGPEFEPRPSMNRPDTSIGSSSSKSKAVDLTSPPYTKEYIDNYRQRIKSDPDPEAHFQYAKYLVDAARKTRSTAKDQRAARKYTEILIAEALKVIRRLASQNEPYDEAQFYLANCYGTGALGLQVDHERAYHLYLQAAKQNHAAACYRVAVCNEIGAGTRKEPPRAAAFYRKAASLGDIPAMYKLGMILLTGQLGEAKNPREAINWLKRAAEDADEENPHALHELGLLHEDPMSKYVPYDPAYAKSLFTQAAQYGYTQSQFKLGQCYEFGSLGCPIDPKRSIYWYTKAAEKGDAEAELALSGWYLTGSEGVLKQSDSEAYLWARRAAAKGLSKAEYAVGYYAEVGIGVKQDIEFAKRWYLRAAGQGNKRAMNRLTEMKRQGTARRTNIARPTRQQAQDDCVIC